jgi:putative cardiolipin synthase
MTMNRIPKLVSALLFLVISGCASLPENTNRQESYAFDKPETTELGKKYAQRAVKHPAGQSGYHLLSDGLDAFVARAALAQVADHSIDSQYYMVHGDLVGLLYMDQLLKAADRGVRVRFLLDDMDEGGRDFSLANFDYHPHIEVRIFNPFGRNTGKTMQFLTGFGKQTRRAHNKSFTMDNIATIVGGRNIGDEYFDADGVMDFADLDVLGIGPIAKQVSASFDQYWNHSLSYPISFLVKEKPTAEDYRKGRAKLEKFIAEQSESAYLKSLRNSELAESVRNKDVVYHWADGKVFADPPDKLLVKTGDKAYQMWTDLKPYVAKAENELLIISPYFVPGDNGVEFLADLVKKGIRVRILTNSLASTDVSVVHAGYARYRKPLLRAGIELYELNKKTAKSSRQAVRQGKIGTSETSLHAKTFIVDRKKVFIGSLNLDARSVIQNTEIGIVIDSTDIADLMSDEIDDNIDRAAFKLALDVDDEGNEHTTWTGLIDGEQKTLTTEPYTSFWKRFVTSFLRLMPIESQI